MMTPRETDTQLAELYARAERARGAMKMTVDRLHRAVGDLLSRSAINGPASWQLTRSEALARGREMIAKGIEYAGSSPCEAGRAVIQFDEIRAELFRISSDQAPLEAEYAKVRWNRYFLVTNASGHVHRDMTCPTCFPTTQYAWLPELSGCDEAEMITEFGEKACTVCFPDAPANPAFHGPGRRDREAIEARIAERAEREAKKAAKTLTGAQQFRIDRGQFGELITTVAACKEALRHEVKLRDYYGSGAHPDHPAWADGAEQAKRVLLERERLQPGTGATQDEIDRIIGNAVKKNRRDGARI